MVKRIEQCPYIYGVDGKYYCRYLLLVQNDGDYRKTPGYNKRGQVECPSGAQAQCASLYYARKQNPIGHLDPTKYSPDNNNENS